MKAIRFFFQSAICASALTHAQTIHAGQPSIFFLNEKSQSNILVAVCNFSPTTSCPPKYTNLLSNTNLFSPEEQKLLKDIPIKYAKMTTNTGPSGSILTRLDRVTFGEDNEQAIMAHFSYTNSVAQEDFVFVTNGQKIVKYQSTPGNGYYAGLVGDTLGSYQGLRDGTLNGLCVTFYEKDLVEMLLHYTNGKALGKFYVWTRAGAEFQGVGLAVDAEFKEPYDFQKNLLMPGSDMTMIDKPKSKKNLWKDPAIKP
jgi:hypothetical protein